MVEPKNLISPEELSAKTNRIVDVGALATGTGIVGPGGTEPNMPVAPTARNNFSFGLN